MAHALDAPELLGVDVQQIPGALMLVAQDRLGGLQIAQPRQPARASTRPTVLFDTPRLAAMRAWVRRRRRSSTIASALAGRSSAGCA